MLYSEVMNNKNFFLEKKEKYTMRDVDKLIINSLFMPYQGRILTTQEAKFICRCWAVCYETEYSKAVAADEKQKAYFLA